MPALFGGVGCPPECLHILKREHTAVWDDVQTVRLGGGLLGSHAHKAGAGMLALPDGRYIGVDGEHSAYQTLATATDAASRLFRIESGRLRLRDGCRANLALGGPTGPWFLAAELSGAFPLYYTSAGDGLLFSSHLRPLVGALAPLGAQTLDLTGVLESAIRGYTSASRTHFVGIDRLRPGQVLRFDPLEGQLSIEETSRLWTDPPENSSQSLSRAAETCWPSLTEAMQRVLPMNRPNVLMMSGGWDSRTLLAAMQQTLDRETLTCYSHGDAGSRELAIVSALCAAAGVEYHAEPLTAEPYDLERLDTGFGRAETAQYPLWLHAGQVLATREDVCVSSGVYGEALGGHQGNLFFQRGVGKVISTSALLLRRDPGHQATGVDLPRVRDLVRARQTQKPWFLTEDVWSSMPDYQEETDADLEQDLRRLVDRGISTDEQLIEAYLIEGRHAQRFAGQVLSCRASVDVAIPFADGEVLALASRLPIAVKVQNSLNREMLLKRARSLTNFPTAATLIAAGRPIVLQEASRLVRRVYESNHWRLHHATRSVMPPPQIGWSQDESLQNGRVFNTLLGDLRSDIWDRNAIRARIAENAKTRFRLHPQSRTEPLRRAMMRIASVDRMLRYGLRPLRESIHQSHTRCPRA